MRISRNVYGCDQVCRVEDIEACKAHLEKIHDQVDADVKNGILAPMERDQEMMIIYMRWLAGTFPLP